VSAAEQEPAPRAAQPRWLRGLCLLAGALLYLSFGYTEMAGSDMWWHVAAGRELLQTGTLWMVDDWSYTELGSDWLNHEWLSDLIYWGWTSLWGVHTLVYWKWLVIVAAFTLLQLALARSSGSALAGLLCAGLAAAIAAPFLDVRPHLYTLLNFGLLLFLALGRRPRTGVLVLLYVVWVNLHGGFFFGLMALAILLFPWRDLRPQTLRAALLVGLACVAAALLNPSGYGTFLYPLKYAFDDTSPFRRLAEWLPPSDPGGIRSPLFFVFQWAPLLGLLYLLSQVRQRTGVPWEGMALTALTLAMALTSRRFIPIFAMSLALLLAPLAGALLGLLRARAVQGLLACCALVFAILRLQPYPLQAAPAFHYLVAEYTYPADVVDFVQANELRGKVFAYYNWGGYLHWRTDGALKVYIDGRADTLYDAATYNSYVDVMKSMPGWVEQVEASGAQYFLWPNRRWRGGEKLQALLRDGGWKPLYQGSEGYLMVRSDVVLPQTLQAPPPSPYRDYSSAWIAAQRGQGDIAEARAREVLAAIPWHRGACTLLATVLRRQERESEGDAVIAACRRQFPSTTVR